MERVYRTIKSVRPTGVQFSIGPFGLYRPGSPSGMPPPISGLDPYSKLYANSLLWLQRGWLDFMAPQLYWAVNSTGQSYPALLDWWLHHNSQDRYHAQLMILYTQEKEKACHKLHIAAASVRASQTEHVYSLGRSLIPRTQTLACIHTATRSPILPFSGLHPRNPCNYMDN